MKTNQELLIERTTRLKKAIALEKPDRTPVIAWADAFCANYMGVKMSEFSSNMILSSDTMVNTFKDFPTLDATEVATTAPDAVAMGFLSKMKIAGRDLPEGSNWIVDEQERLSVEDYDTILNMGWTPFYMKFLNEKLGIDVQTFFAKIGEATGYGTMKFIEAGIPVYSVAIGPAIPLETLAGGRTMAKFIQDLYRMPDKIQAVMDIMMDEIVAQTIGALNMSPEKPLTVFLGIARGAGEFLSPKLWQRFTLPYMVKIINSIIGQGVVCNLHFDSCWDRDLEYLKQFPKGTCVFGCDHLTDIYKIKGTLGESMAVKGDVPSAMLAFGTPDDVYNYSTRLIKDMGNGFILAPACTLPANAKVENVKALLAAVEGK
ncbi:MAG: uroporphyrinogen decarboxylase family protein [Clostridiales bacterium]|nr:uroporphyrinogen-III decarboxylase [Eubacteriales bacterium]MDH7567010.1 uroporphyrinogen decarboxylase family protein [Clostridiales bacterium]